MQETLQSVAVVKELLGSTFAQGFARDQMQKEGVLLGLTLILTSIGMLSVTIVLWKMLFELPTIIPFGCIGSLSHISGSRTGVLPGTKHNYSPSITSGSNKVLISRPYFHYFHSTYCQFYDKHSSPFLQEVRLAPLLNFEPISIKVIKVKHINGLNSVNDI